MGRGCVRNPADRLSKMVKMVSDYLGDHLLMFSTDYPHPETRLPGVRRPGLELERSERRADAEDPLGQRRQGVRRAVAVVSAGT
jgi:hypothetical protein